MRCKHEARPATHINQAPPRPHLSGLSLVPRPAVMAARQHIWQCHGQPATRGSATDRCHNLKRRSLLLSDQPVSEQEDASKAKAMHQNRPKRFQTTTRSVNARTPSPCTRQRAGQRLVSCPCRVSISAATHEGSTPERDKTSISRNTHII